MMGKRKVKPHPSTQPFVLERKCGQPVRFDTRERLFARVRADLDAIQHQASCRLDALAMDAVGALKDAVSAHASKPVPLGRGSATLISGVVDPYTETRYEALLWRES
jgi:hypothetical protein